MPFCALGCEATWKLRHFFLPRDGEAQDSFDNMVGEAALLCKALLKRKMLRRYLPFRPRPPLHYRESLKQTSKLRQEKHQKRLDGILKATKQGTNLKHAQDANGHVPLHGGRGTFGEKGVTP
jgi:hypothetical protein